MIIKKELTNEEMRSVIRKIIVITMGIDGEVSKEELKIFKDILKISLANKVELSEHFKLIKTNIPKTKELFEKDLKKVSCPKQRGVIFKIFFAVMLADGVIADEELELFKLISKVYTNIHPSDVFFNEPSIDAIIRDYID